MKRSLLIGILLCLAGSACGNDEPQAVQEIPTTLASPSPSPSPSPTAPVELSGLVNNMGVKDFSGVGTNVAVEFQVSDFAFSPTFIKVLPGTSVNFSLDNTGQARHTFTIDALKVDHELQAGGQAEGQFQLPESGVIPFYCRFHVGRGMQGAFYFMEGDTALVSTPEVSPVAGGTGVRSASSRTRSSGSTRRRATSSAAGPAAGTTAQNREGDLVIPDLQIGEVQQGGSSAAKSPAPNTAGAALSSSPRPVVNTSPKVSSSGPGGQAGAPSKAGEDGGAGDEGDEGSEGEPGETNNNLDDD